MELLGKSRQYAVLSQLRLNLKIFLSNRSALRTFDFFALQKVTNRFPKLSHVTPSGNQW